MRTLHGLVAVIAGMSIGQSDLQAEPEAEARDAMGWLFKAGNYAWEANRSFSSGSGPVTRPSTTDSGETQIGGYTTMVKRRIEIVILGDQIAVKTLDGWRHGRDLPRVELGSYGVTPLAKSGEFSMGVELRHPHEELEHLMGMAHNFRKTGSEIVADLAKTADEFSRLEYYMRGTAPLPQWGGTMKTVGGLLSRGPPRPLPDGHSATLFFRLVGPAIEEFRVEIQRAAANPLEAQDGSVTRFTTTYLRKLSGIGRTTVVVDRSAEFLLLAGKN